jgi:hypothetical protein
MTEDFPEFSGDLPCEKKKECEQEGLNSDPYFVVYPETTVTLHESSKYEILSHSCRKECKISAWTRDKCLTETNHQQGAFSFPERSFILLKCSYTQIIHL